MVRTEMTRWMVEPPAGDDGVTIARWLRDEAGRTAPPIDAGAWQRLEERIRPRRRRARWALWLVAVPALAGAAGSAYLRFARTPDVAPASAPAPKARVSRAVVAPAAQAPATSRAVAPAAPAAPTVEVAPARATAAAPRTQAALPAAASTADLDAIERDAAAARRSGDARGAERGYLALARTSGLRAENALFELGVVRLRMEKNVDGALAAWSEYRSRFPQGQLAAEVDLSVITALEQAGRVPQAIREGESFLARRPQSERAGEVHALVGSLLSQRGDCARALPHLEAGGQALLSDARGDELAYRRALCLRALGGGETARAALREYLDTHPSGRYRDSVERALRE